MKDVIIVCDNIFGLQVYSILEEINKWFEREKNGHSYNILGYISEITDPFGGVFSPIERLGSISDWKPIGNEYYVLGCDIPERKRAVVDCLKAKGCQFETVYTPWMLAPVISIGEGSVVAAYSIKAGMNLGKYVTLIDSMMTSHYVGDYSTVLRVSNITADVGENTYIGNHVYSHTGCKIGDNVIVEDGSIVVKSVKNGSHISGVPARKIKTY